MGNTKGRLGKRAGKDAPGKKAPAAKSLGKGDSAERSVEVLLKKGPISDYYDVDYNTVLGRGHYAVVNLGVDKRSGLKVAVKRIQISKSRVEALHREVEALRKVGRHPNIIALYDIFITETELILVLELLLGGELFDRMVERGPYSEREASHHIRKIGQALKFLHRAGIVHRDLKPENLILAHKGDNSELKIADFGLANIVDNTENATMKTVCGTWAYCAPEVKTSMTEEGGPACYTAKVDIWSVGVILFVILGAYHPFDADGDASDAQLWSNICSGEFDFDDPAWDHISSGAKDLIRKLIVVDPEQRYGTDELLAHPWIRQEASVPATPITPNINKSLIDYNDRRKSRSSLVSKVKRMNGMGRGGAAAAEAPLAAQAITEQDVIEQQQMLEEQRLAEAKQRLQILHYQQQQQLKQQQQQQHQQTTQEMQLQQQQLQQQLMGQSGPDVVKKQVSLQQHQQQQLQQLQQHFQQQHQQLVTLQQQERQQLLQHQQHDQQQQQQQLEQQQQHQQHQQHQAGAGHDESPMRSAVRFADEVMQVKGEQQQQQQQEQQQQQQQQQQQEQHHSDEVALQSSVPVPAPAPPHASADAGAAAVEEEEEEESSNAMQDDGEAPPLPQLTLNTLLPAAERRGGDSNTAEANSSAGGMMEVETPVAQ